MAVRREQPAAAHGAHHQLPWSEPDRAVAVAVAARNILPGEYTRVVTVAGLAVADPHPFLEARRGHADHRAPEAPANLEHQAGEEVAGPEDSGQPARVVAEFHGDVLHRLLLV